MIESENEEDISNRRLKQYSTRVPGFEDKVGGYEPEYITALILVETTSRKAYGYPLHTKSAKEVFDAFKKFLIEVDYKIAKLTSDSGLEYSLIKSLLMQRRYADIFKWLRLRGGTPPFLGLTDLPGHSAE